MRTLLSPLTPVQNPSLQWHQAAYISRTLAIGLLLVVGCGQAVPPPPIATPVSLTGVTMGTIQYIVKLNQLPDGVEEKTLQAAIDEQLELVNDQMSTYRPESEISRFNRSESTDWFEVSSDTARVVAEALRVSRLSDGAFDATVGPLVDLWNFGPQPGEFQVPSDQAISAARERVGYGKIAVRQSPPAVRKQQANVRLDLSAIAKGFAVDQIADYLQSLSVDGYLVEIGGEMRTKGTKPDRTGWTVGIEAPAETHRVAQKAIVLGNRAIATSGDYRQYFDHDGHRYSHTIDPRSGRPVEYGLASVSVIAENCMFADAVATAIMVMGPERGYNFAVKQKLAVLLILRRDDAFVEKPTPLFRSLFETD